MIETCLKCGHVNNAAAGHDTEACPKCGAIYSKVEMAMAAARRPRAPERGKQFWTYTVLIGLLSVLVPLTVYEHTFGTSAKRRKAQASLNLALADQQVREREAADQAHKGLMQLAILEKRVAVGMSAVQVQTSWGQPTSVNRTVTGNGTTEQWVYRQGNAKANYVYLDDGIVRSFQISE